MWTYLLSQAVLVTLDVSALDTNILQKEGLECIREACFSRKEPTVPSEYILRLLEVVLKLNIFCQAQFQLTNHSNTPF